jgi:hypothetical protein
MRLGVPALVAFGFLGLAALFAGPQREPEKRPEPEPPPGPPRRFVSPLEMPTWKRIGSLDGLHPDARPFFDELVDYAKAQGWNPRIASATRTCEEQRGLYESGSSKAACSWHLAGRALDLLLNKNASFHDAYRELGEWWRERGGSWGGTYAGYGEHGDYQHFQWTPPPLKEAHRELCATDDDCAEKQKAYWDKVIDEANRKAVA